MFFLFLRSVLVACSCAPLHSSSCTYALVSFFIESGDDGDDERNGL